jgi:hypothetical protein
LVNKKKSLVPVGKESCANLIDLLNGAFAILIAVFAIDRLEFPSALTLPCIATRS